MGMDRGIEIVRKITGYKTSKDYAALVELMTKTSVLIVIPKTDDPLDQDIARTTCWPEENFYAAGTPGLCCLHASSPEEFIKQCEDKGAEFIPPNSVIGRNEGET